MIATSPQLPALPNSEPSHDCALCPRLSAFREEVKAAYPDWWNAPVPVFGDPAAWLVLVGLAPGKHGAHRTGRPFTGDFAGDLLFDTLAKVGLSRGTYQSRVDDGVTLNGVIIINSVKCLPPQNKPLPAEIGTCRHFLTAQLAEVSTAQIYIALGRIAHDSFLRSQGLRLADYPFGHGAEHHLPGGKMLIDSYHCSRYNQNTGRLTETMFTTIFERAIALRGSLPRS